MRASLSLHLSLYRRQKEQISEAVEGVTAAFRAYEGRYRRRTRAYEEVLTSEQVAEQVQAADIVYVGDYHTLRSAQQAYLDQVRTARQGGRPVVLALEFIEGRHQRALDAYLTGRLTERAFLTRIGHAGGGPYGLWNGFKPVLAFARRHKLPVVAIDRRARGPKSLALRDAYAAERIAEHARAPERPQILVLMGQYHVVPGHLPAQVRAALGRETERKHLVLYQNCEGVYWRLARERKLGQVQAVRVHDGELCLLNASPVVCQQSFLDYLDAEASDAPLLERAAPERFRELARLLGRRLDAPGLVEGLAHVEIGTAGDPSFWDQLRKRGEYSPVELGQVRRQLLQREGCYFPRARMAYLGSLSLNHAAEEAAHFVRHLCVGDGAMERPRRRVEAFYARCLEEALGFLGSRLINPDRRCPDLDAWARTFESERGPTRQIAAFVLAHKAAEQAEEGRGANRLIPLHTDGLFHGVSHALGYLLGDALHRAHDTGELTNRDLRALFRDPFARPVDQYFALARGGEALRTAVAQSRTVLEAQTHRLA